MTKFFLILIFMGVVMGLPVFMNVTMSNEFITDTTKKILSTIVRNLSHTRLPDINKTHEYAIFSIKEIDTVNISFDEAKLFFIPNNTLRINDILPPSLGTAKVRARVGPYDSHANISFEITGVRFDINISLVSVAGKPNIQTSRLDYEITNDNIRIYIPDGPIQGIQTLIGRTLKEHIINHLPNLVKSKMPEMLYHEVNDVLNTFSTDIRISDEIHLKYNFPIDPLIKDDHTATEVDAYFYSVDKPIPPFKPDPMPEIQIDTKKKLQFIISYNLFKSGLHVSRELNLLSLKLDFQLEYRKLDIVCIPDKIPDFSYNAYMYVKGPCVCNVTINRDYRNSFKLLFDYSLKYYLEQNKAIIELLYKEVEFFKIAYINENGVDIKWFEQSISKVLSEISWRFRTTFYPPRIPLPTMKGIDYGYLSADFKSEYLILFGTPVSNSNILNSKEVIEVDN